MGPSKKMRISFMIWLVACLCATSCGPASPEKAKRESAEGQKETQEGVLSKEQIIKIANREARRLGRDLSQTDVRYDVGNVVWKRVAPGPWPKLEGHDYQAVSYWRRPPATEGGLWILVDRKTGEILMIGSPP
jgi:hypothetical protein